MHGLSAVTIEGQLLQPPCAPENANGHQLLEKREENEKALIWNFIEKKRGISRIHIQLNEF